jgi:selenocysteine-specific elongation factor
VERRGVVEVSTLQWLGVPTSPVPSSVVAAGSWLMSADRAERAADEVPAVVAAHDRAHPLDPGLPLGVVAERVGLPSPDLVTAVLRPPLRFVGGRVLAGSGTELPPDVERAVTQLAADLAGAPFAAPTADRLRELGLDTRRVAAAAKADRLLRLAPGIVLLPGAIDVAVARLSELPQPFTTSEARVRLDTSRRVVLPLLDHLDRAGLTRRLPDDRREVV